MHKSERYSLNVLNNIFKTLREYLSYSCHILSVLAAS